MRYYFTHSLALHASLPFTLLIVFTSSITVVIYTSVVCHETLVVHNVVHTKIGNCALPSLSKIETHQSC